ncbi:MAG: NAD(P)/FAD-dependent oxidoreductase [bacterium]|nr:NAD(P)/FAD-dependent oxidoreductase [bacterium]
MGTLPPAEAEPVDFDVAVVGAGPAGATCALDLARAGVRVALLDKAAPPRYKTCGGGIVGRALRFLDVDVGSSVERSLNRVELNIGGLGFAVERSPAPVVMAMRATFDSSLVEAALEAGARLLAPWAFRGLRSEGTRIEIGTDRGAIGVSSVVGADGAGSRVARMAGWGKPPRSVPAIESEIRVPREILDRFAGAARFDFGWIPHGYGWVFPKRSHLSVGCLATRRASYETRSSSLGLNHHFERYLRKLNLDHAFEREDHGFAIPTRPRDRRLARDRVLLVGDAAGLGDPLTCEGISHAILSGQLAARALIETREEPHLTEERYQALLERFILPELRWARRLAPLLYDYPRLRSFVFRRVGVRLCESLADVFCGSRTYQDLMHRPTTYRRLLGGLLRSWVGT